MADTLAILTLIAWPVIPLYWIPLHLFPSFFKRAKALAYLIPAAIWLPLAYILYLKQGLLVQAKVVFPLLITLTGAVLLVTGTLLHLWTGKLLSLRGLIGLPELSESPDGPLVRKGAFAVVRHPTYLAHTLMFSGVFFLSGVITVGAVTVIDFSVVNLVIIPLEEKELMERFGDDYREYRNDVPAFFPKPWQR